jgi:hypothetical protein
MSVCIQTGAESQRLLARRAEFRRQLDGLPSWQERAPVIDQRVREIDEALSLRNEKLLALRGDFDALTLDFWRTFARNLGCENSAETIAQEQARATVLVLPQRCPPGHDANRPGRCLVSGKRPCCLCDRSTRNWNFHNLLDHQWTR